MIGLLASIALTGPPARAAQHNDRFASNWQTTPYSRARLIVAGRGLENAQVVDAGLEINLDPGWKIYWRVPGGAGVPPLFDFKASENVASADVKWPAPHRYRDQYGDTIGYKDKVVFPLEITPARRGQPVTARLNLIYAVCREICLPAKASFEVNIPAQFTASSPYRADLEQFRAQVPQGPERISGVKVADVRLDRSGEEPMLLVSLDGRDADAPTNVFIEGPDDLYFGPSKRTVEGANDHAIRIAGLDPSRSLSGQKLRLTVVAGDNRLQQNWRLD